MSRPGRHRVDLHYGGRPVHVYLYCPPGLRADAPVVMVQHGVHRNGRDYRTYWREAARRHGLLVVAPSFAAAHWPGRNSYSEGNVLRRDGSVRPPHRWSLSVPGRVLADLRLGGSIHPRRVWLFGHSAGAQFAHRLLAMGQEQSFDAIAAANAGWYTLPCLTRPWPQGLGGVGLEEADLGRILRYPLQVMVGGEDRDTAHSVLPRHDWAHRQGPHRLARAQHFFAHAVRQAERLGVPFGWRFTVIPGVGHDGQLMVRAAARAWLESGYGGA